MYHPSLTLGRKGSLMGREYVSYTGHLCHLIVDPKISTFPIWEKVVGGAPNTKPRVTVASDVAEIQAAVENDPSYPTLFDHFGFSCLHQICSVHSPGQVEVLEVLCSKNGYVNVLDGLGRTPLHHALSPENLKYHSKTDCGSHLLRLIEKLLDFGANVNTSDVYGLTPFHLALDVYGSGFSGWLVTLPAIITMFMAAGADFSLRIPIPLPVTSTQKDYDPSLLSNASLYTTVVHLACSMNGPASMEVVSLLLKPENVNSRDCYKRNPLHDLVISIGKTSLKPAWSRTYEEKLLTSKLSLLCDLGVDVNAKDLSGATPLCLAVQKHDFGISSEVIVMLIQYGASVNDRFSKNGLTPLHLLCQNLEKFASNLLPLFLEAGGQPDAKDLQGRTPLHYAAENPRCQLSTLLHLGHAGAKFTAADCLGNNALHFVCNQENPNFELVKFLLTRGCSVGKRNRFGNTPLHLSLQKCRNEEVIKYLIRCGADVCATNGEGFDTLSIACWPSNRFSTSLVFTIIRGGADVNATDRYNRTPLLREVLKDLSRSDLETSKLLLLSGADPNHRAVGFGSGPLHVACSLVNLAMIELLLDGGADVNMVSHIGTPLHCVIEAAEKNHPKDQIIDMLIKRGANVNAVNQKGDTPLHCAAQFKVSSGNISGHSGDQTFGSIVKRYASVNTKNNSSHCPMQNEKRDCFRTNMRIVHLLLIAGADPNCKDYKTKAPLHIAAENGNHYLTKLLLDFGADPNLVDGDGLTPLHKATSSLVGKPNLTWMILVSNGADPSVEDFEGDTPLLKWGFKTYRPFMAYVAIMISAGRYSLSENEKSRLTIPGNLTCCGQNDFAEHFTSCLKYAQFLSEDHIGPITLAEFLLGPTNQMRQLIKNPEITRELLLMQENPHYSVFYTFFKCKLSLLQTINSLNDDAVKAMQLLYTKPLPLHVLEKILSYLTDLDLVSLAMLHG